METLTSQQRAAVENRGGSLLVSAAAGSGKTKVLVERLFRYVAEEGRNLDDFLIITYTKAAAAELRGRIAAELSRRIGRSPGDERLRRQLLRVYQADIKTVDAFCTALLRENTHLLAEEGEGHALTPDFRVLDEGEAALLRERVLRRVLEKFYEDLTPGRELLADTMGEGRDDSALAELALEVFGKLQSHAYPGRWLEKSREAWENLGGSFDGTAWAAELLDVVRRRAAHWNALLREGAARTEGDSALWKGYGTKFLTAASGMETVMKSGTWEEARTAAAGVTFPRLTTPKGRKEELRGLKQVWDLCKDEWKKTLGLLSVSGGAAMEDVRAIAPAMTALLDLVGEFSGAYRAEKLRVNALDFSDQEHLALRLLAGEDGAPTELGKQISGRYVEILVDEYQDTNEVQNAIFRAVSRREKNLFFVGDVKQSIYRFRLADPTIFLDKYSRFARWEEAEEGEGRKILLSRNFRSRREVLDAVNFVFSGILSPSMGEMEYGADEALYFGAEYYPERADCAVEYHLVSARRGADGDEPPVKRITAEARCTAKRVRELLESGFPVTEGDGKARPCRPEDIVILLRSPRSRTAAFYEAFAEQKIPCSFEESGGFYQSMEISTALSLLEVVDNPRQDVPLISVLRSPVFSFSPDRLAEIRSRDRGGDYYDAVKADGGPDCMAFLETLAGLREAAREFSVHELLWHLYNTLNLPGIFGAMDGGAERRENLIAFSRQAEQFESGGYRGLFAFITQIRRLIDTGRAPEVRSGSGGGVRLMSIHRSKGLEFPIVILADLSHAFSRQDFAAPVLVHPEMGLGPEYVDLKRRIRYPTLARLAVRERLRRENLAEEQRILYVAMTRAKEKLILIHSLYNAPEYLRRLAAASGYPAPPETAGTAKCFGDWLFMVLPFRREAGSLRAFAELETESLYGGEDAPWKIALYEAEAFREGPVRAEAPTEDAGAVSFEPGLLEWEYPYPRETGMPAKVTATQLKGRTLDDEIAENAAHVPYLRPLSQPKFRWERSGLTPAERGTATHLMLQYLDFEGGDPAEQAAELVRRRLLTPEQAAAVDIPAVRRFLMSGLAEEIRRGRNVRREYPFTILLDAAEYGAVPGGEGRILLQGVVDCCFETDAGITIVDFKTDHVFGEEAVRERSGRYLPQIQAYSRALARVLEKPVSRRVLYFLAPGKTIEV